MPSMICKASSGRSSLSSSGGFIDTERTGVATKAKASNGPIVFGAENGARRRNRFETTHVTNITMMLTINPDDHVAGVNVGMSTIIITA
ncbi:hypothetical protein KEM60_00655 [Austwickia sp. TVS 96-490-7B]|nr:hypothetical protein [Austwickia sp. TVS 96-490-7B]